MATKFRLQFNLKTTLLLMSIIALVIFGYSRSSKIREQAVRIQELEDELQAGRESGKSDCPPVGFATHVRRSIYASR